MSMDIDKLKEIKTMDLTEAPEYLDKVFQVVCNSIKEQSFGEECKNLKSIKQLYEGFFTEYKLYEDISKQRIYYFAVLKTLIDILEHFNDLNNEKTYFIELKNKHKYLESIMEYLHSKHSISDVEMSKELNMKIDVLTNYMNEISELNLFSVVEFKGRYLYFINSNGKKFHDSIKN